MSKSWLTSAGTPATGSKDDAFRFTDYKIIPNDTKVLASIQDMVRKSNDWLFNANGTQGREVYSITWLIIEGEFEGRKIWQELDVWNDDKIDVSDRDLNIMSYLYNLFNLERPSNLPTNMELGPFIGKLATIKVRQRKPKEGKPQYYWIAEINEPAGETEYVAKASTSSAVAAVTPLNDDIPF